MAPGFAFDAGALPQFLAVAGMLGLGVFLLVLHFESRLNRVFSLFLVVRGLSMLTATEWQLLRHTDPQAAAFWVEVFPYFTIATPLVLAYFVWIYPGPRRDIEPRWLPAALVTGAIVVLEAAYVIEPALWGTYAISAGGSLTTVDQGPLSAMLGLVFVMFAIAGLVFARDAIREPAGPQRRSLLLVSLAFTVNALFDGTGTGLIVFGAIDFPARIPEYLGTVSLVPALGAPVLLVRQALRSGDERATRHASLYTGVSALAVGAALGTIFLSSLWQVFLVATGVLRLALPVLVAYALLRHQLFDIDLKVRLGIERGTVGAVFAGAFFVASEGLEQFVPVDGPVLGLIAAGGIALALRPIHRMAQRLAGRVGPAYRPVEQLDDTEGRDFYRQQARIVWSDDNVTEKERAMLDHLREQIGISENVADGIEAEVRGIRQPHDPLIGGAAHA